MELKAGTVKVQPDPDLNHVMVGRVATMMALGQPPVPDPVLASLSCGSQSKMLHQCCKRLQSTLLKFIESVLKVHYFSTTTRDHRGHVRSRFRQRAVVDLHSFLHQHR